MERMERGYPILRQNLMFWDFLSGFVTFFFWRNPHIGFITYCSQQAIIRQVGRPSNQYACYQLDDNYYYCLLLLFLLTRLYSKGSM